MRLADFILSHIQTILEEWEGFARTMPPAAASMTTTALRNHASDMLKSVAQDLGTAQSPQEEITKSHGQEARTMQTEAGEQHGLARLESKFTIEQLASEYRALRSSVLRLWSEANSAPNSTDIGDIIRFNEAIDQLLAASVFGFANATRELPKRKKSARISSSPRLPMNCAIRFLPSVPRPPC